MLGEIPEKVHVLFFGSEKNCRSCKDTMNFVSEFCDLNEQLEFEAYDTVQNEDQKIKYNIDKVPSIVVLDKDRNDFGIRFYGIPAGYEIHSLIASVRELGGVSAGLPAEIEERISKIDKEIHIQVFVTPTCSYCPGAVITGHRLAFLNKNIKTDMIEANSFPDEAAKYGVKSVPKIVINEDNEFVGTQPITKYLEIIESI